MTTIKASIMGEKVMNIDALRHLVLSYCGVAGLKEHKEKMVDIADSIMVLDNFNKDWLDGCFDEEIQETQYKLSLGGQMGLIKKLCRRFPPLARHLNKATRKTIYNYDKAFGKLHSKIHRQFEKEVCYQIYLEGGMKVYD